MRRYLEPRLDEVPTASSLGQRERYCPLDTRRIVNGNLRVGDTPAALTRAGMCGARYIANARGFGHAPASVAAVVRYGGILAPTSVSRRNAGPGCSALGRFAWTRGSADRGPATERRKSVETRRDVHGVAPLSKKSAAAPSVALASVPAERALHYPFGP